MNTTSLSLLGRLKTAKPDAADWQKLKDVYLPLIQSWLASFPGLQNDAEDLAQEVFLALLRELPSFERQRHGSFRAWLRITTLHRVRAFWKSRRRCGPVGGDPQGEVRLTQLEDSTSDPAQQWDRDHDRYVLRKLLVLVQPDFAPKTWRAFTRSALDGAAAKDVAQELGITEGAVVQAKFRVLKRLREEAGEFLS
jgi:RNA polymerase sigma-70 factor (ECF subfamily)